MEKETKEIVEVHASLDLYGAPSKVMQQRVAAARELVKLVEESGAGRWVVEIKGNKYPKYEAQVTVASFFGLVPRIVEVKKVSDAPLTYQATAEVVHIPTQQVVSRGVGLCSAAEKVWSEREEFAVLAMAQTRAAGRALRMILAPIFVLAGVEPTPAEEMIEHSEQAERTEQAEQSQQQQQQLQQRHNGATQRQREYIDDLLRNVVEADEGYAEEVAEWMEHLDGMSQEDASRLIKFLQILIKTLPAQDAQAASASRKAVAAIRKLLGIGST